MSFKRIHYDYYNNKIYHWYIDENGTTRREECHPPLEYYVQDNEKKSSITDIFGNPVIKKTSEDRRNIKFLKENFQTCELNISPEIAFLQKRYGNKELTFNINDFQVCTLDIEVASGYTGYSKDHLISIKKEDKTFTSTVYDFEYKVDRDDYLVFDEEKEKYVKFNKSCYFTNLEFPSPELAKYPINLISLHFSKQDKIYTFGLQEYTGSSDLVKNYIYCKDEKILLEKFILFFRKMKVDITTGWFSKSFDFPYIINRCKRLGIELSLSPVNEYREKSKQAGYHVDGGGYEICGISTLDGLDLYKNFVYEKEVSYNLNDIGMKVVGEGKLQYAGSINDLWKYDWNTFVEYNIQDVILTRKIELKKRHIDLAINLCYRSLVPFEKVFSSVNLVTGSVIRHLHQNNMVLNDFPKRSKESKIPGAFCYAKSGYYKYAINFDVTSLYPHMVMMYNISLETLLKDVIDITDDIQVTPLSEYKTWIVKDGEEINVGGIYYRKDKVGILPTITKEMFDQRVMYKNKQKIAEDLESNISIEEIYKKYGQKKVDEIIEAGFKSDYYDSQQLVRKIWINALYGCMTNEFFPMFSIENGMTVTLSGQELIKYLSNGFNDYINKEWSNLAKEFFNKDIQVFKNQEFTIINDTDSGYFHLEPLAKSLGIEFKSNEEFEQFAIKCEKEIIQPFFNKILKEYADSYKAPNIIKFKRENIISKMIVLAKKKYAMEVINSEGKSFVDKPKIKIKGIEIIKTDTSLFSRKRLRELVDYIFETEDKDKVLSRIAEIKEEFMKQDIFDIAISKNAKEYTKWCKPTEEYIKEGMDYKLRIPMHIKAAQNYNYFVKRNNLPYQEIANGNKVKFVYVFENNLLNTYVIGFMGKFPDEFQKEFNIDYETQWEKSFVSIIQRFFDVLGWGKINSDNLCLDELWELCQ